MAKLSDSGQQYVTSMAKKYGLSEDAVTHMLVAISNGHGSMAQFNHPEFGGYGQWMRGGMTMVSDLFNYQLKSRVDGICNDLANAIDNHQITPYTGSFQSQSQGNGYDNQAQANGGGFGQNNLFAPDPEANWWPTEIGSPNATGSQNNVKYAYFANTNRLAVKTGSEVWVYDTLNHNIGGFGQQQGSGGSITFTSQFGTVNLSTLPVVMKNGVKQQPAQPANSPPMNSQPAPPQPAPLQPFSSPSASMSYSEPAPSAPVSNSLSPSSASPSAAGGSNILETLERLGSLKDKGYISDTEFNQKKAELLSRL
ncbi:SHOCT domain-containing protein [Lacunimicrobium album]